MSQTNPIHPVGIDHVVFLVTDMPRALAFYEGVLNCRPGFSYPSLGMEQVWFGSALIVLWDVGHPGAAAAVPPVLGGRNVDHVCLSCAPFSHDALRDHLAQHGIAIEREAIHGGARGMGASFYVRDPDGNKIEIKGPPEHPDLPGPHA
ncbi:VOC family protein [Silicimonas algicola]|uniref:Catechol 2,3-dioxygenase-like lactoylglutathione lyase family enzyme n=1 Tax=Silicimonas algicola TaxID=1826607 RepID=A0A316FZN2_9RHOB|nr:VOC family protein [Silicimonas algicola]PWK54101.1 catechol 2,3-dioxygenase-like lactoylglutathione lyase family enzyme [Silicimonas algicola]